ncbi:hypothetical protein ACF1BQ_015590 [Bradyrhizobium sp. RDT10]
MVLLAGDREGTADSVERLMGTKAEARLAFVSDKAESPATTCWTSDFSSWRRLSGYFRLFQSVSARICPFSRHFPVIRFPMAVLPPQQLFGRNCV